MKPVIPSSARGPPARGARCGLPSRCWGVCLGIGRCGARGLGAHRCSAGYARGRVGGAHGCPAALGRRALASAAGRGCDCSRAAALHISHNHDKIYRTMAAQSPLTSASGMAWATGFAPAPGQVNGAVRAVDVSSPPSRPGRTLACLPGRLQPSAPVAAGPKARRASALTHAKGNMRCRESS